MQLRQLCWWFVLGFMGCRAAGSPTSQRLINREHRLAATVTPTELRVADTSGAGSPFAMRVEGWGAGHVARHGDSIVVTRDGLVERYTSSASGLRQDFVIEHRPMHEGSLRVGLAIEGASVAPDLEGATLVTRSGRVLGYHELYVTDATGRELIAQMDVHGLHALEIVVDDHDAQYPVTIDPTISDAQWHSLGGVPGTDRSVRAAVVAPGGVVYVAGTFNIAGDVVVNHVAKWDGASWTALGTGTNAPVYALALDAGGNLYAGGSFTTAGATTANRVAMWNGTAWAAVGTGMNSDVYALALDATGLYAGGYFTTAGGITASHIAKWNGTTWSAVGAGFSTGWVNALAFDGAGNLYAGGYFTGYVSKWNGTSWSALGTGVNGGVYALAYSGGSLYVGGSFSLAGGATASNIAKWNGTAWSALGTGMDSIVSALAFDSGGKLYAGGYFSTAGGTAAPYIASWNATSWSSVGTGADNAVYSLVADGTTIYAGGLFNTVGATTAKKLAKWSGSAWSAIGSGTSEYVQAFAFDGTGNLYAGGGFATIGGVAANHVAKRSAGTWSALGTGMNGDVLALAVDGSGNVYAGGSFTMAGGVAVNYVAEWTGSSWNALGTGTNAAVNGLAVDASGNLYAGGQFTMAGGTTVNYIARWNGTTWSALGSGMSGVVNALAFDAAGNLHAGGYFTSAGGTAAASIAKWSGTAWSALGSGANSPVYSMAFDAAGNLYIGGDFSSAGGVTASHVARWNGSTWSAVGAGTDTTVRALAVDGSGRLIAGGYFALAGGSTAARIAQWNGTAWSTFGSGMFGGGTYGLAVSDGNLYAGGGFSEAGGVASAYVARFDLPPGAQLATTVPEPTSTSPIPVTLIFSEDVTGFSLGDLAISNGSASNLVTVSPRSYTFDVTPSGPGVVTIALPADVVQAVSDGNGNYAAASLIRTYSGPDTTAPQVTSIVRTTSAFTNADTVTFTVTFSEPVTGVDAADFVLTATGTAAGTITTVTGSGSTYTVTVTTVTGDGTLRLDVVGSPTIVDLATNPLAGPYTSGQAYTIDNTPPNGPTIAAISTDRVLADGITNDTTLVISGSADPNVGVEIRQSSVVVLGTATSDNAGAWSLDYTAFTLANGTYSLTATAVDGAGNRSTESAAFVATIDTVAPQITSIVRSDASPTSADTLHFTVAFGESVVGVDAASFAIASGSTATGSITSVTGSGTSYTVTVGSISGDGALGVTLAASSTVTDLAGNPPAAFTSGETYEVDNTGPAAPAILGIADDTDTAGDGVTTDTTLVFVGTSEPSVPLEISIDGAIAGMTTATVMGTWTFDHTSAALAVGAHTVTAVASDPLGNRSQPSPGFAVTIVAPTEPPPAEDSGCGCQSGSSPDPAPLLVLVALVAVRRRSRATACAPSRPSSYR